MKTVREWLNEFPVEIRDRAIRNAENDRVYTTDEVVSNMPNALMRAFAWGDAPEPSGFWTKWHTWLKDPSRPKPTIQPADGSVVVGDHSGDVNEKIETLTKRERFAMAAMHSMVQNPHYAKMTNDQVAASSVMQADALISELQKPKP